MIMIPSQIAVECKFFHSLSLVVLMAGGWRLYRDLCYNIEIFEFPLGKHQVFFLFKGLNLRILARYVVKIAASGHSGL